MTKRELARAINSGLTFDIWVMFFLAMYLTGHLSGLSTIILIVVLVVLVGFSSQEESKGGEQ